MNVSYWFFCLIVGCLACAKSSNVADPDVPAINGPYRVTALLNDSTWYGSAAAFKTISIGTNTACTSDRFDVRFSTDLPYNNNVPKQTVTGCLSNCIPTQVLVFHNVPLAVGKYDIVTLNSCAGQDGAANYYWLLGGDGIIKTYTSKANSTGWIQVTGYNPSQKAIEGTFEIELADQTTQKAKFQRGGFTALLN